MSAKQRTLFILVLVMSLTLSGCGLGQAVGPTNTPVPTNTPLPTNTPVPTNMPTATPAPSVVGKLVEAPIFTPPDGTSIARPILANEIVFLCLKIQKKCTIDKTLSVKTDDSGGFVFNSLPAGEYVVLYAAFLSQQEDAKSEDNFWAYWDGRELDFSSMDSFAASFVDPTNTAVVPQFISDRGYGVLSEISQQTGGMVNTAICYLPQFMAVEFVGDMVPLTVTVIPGQTVELTVDAHAGLVFVMF